MPHFVMEYTPAEGVALDVQKMMSIALEAGSASGFIERDNIKVRAMQPEAILLGDDRTSFIHVTLYLLEGRSTAQKLVLAQTLTGQLRAAFPEIGSISMDTRDMNPGCYKKNLD